ncbi:MAG: sterol desaturase family protein [Candidatus Acidiferrales bacterium]
MSIAEPRHFGSGWISGVLSTILAAMGFGGVLCLLFPEYLTTPELRAIYPMDFMRGLIHLVLVGGFALGFVSVVLRRNKTLGVAGLLLATLAVLLGGSEVPVDGPVRQSNYLGLDWFLLNLLILALIFVPVERLFARLKEQGIFRQGWRTDLAHFFVSHLLVQVSVFLTMLPARTLFSWALNADLQGTLAALPFVVQFVAILFVSDFSEYWIHRWMHRVPWLWRFHAIHHSIEKMDWLAASRLHLVDIVIVRAVTFIPLFILGFANGPVFAYLVFVSFHAIFIHANVNFRFGWLDWLIATPRFHHWHHSAQPEAIDKNFAVHLPLLDRLFGTLLLPRGNAWPSHYGIAGNPVPEGYLQQMAYPIRRQEHSR